jgi:hypothetical protein
MAEAELNLGWLGSKLASPILSRKSGFLWYSPPHWPLISETVVVDAMATVLCTGVDRVLNETRTLILRQAGHAATSAMEEHEIIHACKEQTFDVVVVGQAMSDAQKLHTFEIIRQHCKSAKILELYLPFSGRALKQADGWLEVPAKLPSDLAVHVERLAANGASS